MSSIENLEPKRGIPFSRYHLFSCLIGSGPYDFIIFLLSLKFHQFYGISSARKDQLIRICWSTINPQEILQIRKVFPKNETIKKSNKVLDWETQKRTISRCSSVVVLYVCDCVKRLKKNHPFLLLIFLFFWMVSVSKLARNNKKNVKRELWMEMFGEGTNKILKLN